jgi:hypothetical protein
VGHSKVGKPSSQILSSPIAVISYNFSLKKKRITLLKTWFYKYKDTHADFLGARCIVPAWQNQRGSCLSHLVKKLVLSPFLLLLLISFQEDLLFMLPADLSYTFSIHQR